jgi:hypothetical protein
MNNSLKQNIGYYSAYPFVCMYYKTYSTYLSMLDMDAYKFKGDMILENLYLGDVRDAYNAKALKSFGITDIITLVPAITPGHPNEFTYSNYPLLDFNSEDLIPHINKILLRIEEIHSNGGKVFIHCMMGVSRSASVVIAYLMKIKDIGFDEAFWFVKEKRILIDPNPSFSKQLRSLEK